MMNKRETAIIECPSNLGLKAPAPGREPGVKILPDTFRRLGLHAIIDPISVSRVEAPVYSPKKDGESGLLNEKGLVQYSISLSAELEKQMNLNRVPLLLGGDCSILLGAALALRRLGNFGMFYLDGHTDYMDTRLSQTGGAGGMAAAMVTGYGPASVCQIQGYTNYINPENLICAGNREYHEAYQDEIRNSAATYRPLWQMRGEGMNKLAESYLANVKAKGLKGFWLHFDVDVLNNSVMPCVDSPAPDGLTYEEWTELLVPLLSSPLFSGMTITILDPELDPDDRYTRPLVDRLTKLWVEQVRSSS